MSPTGRPIPASAGGIRSLDPQVAVVAAIVALAAPILAAATASYSDQLGMQHIVALMFSTPVVIIEWLVIAGVLIGGGSFAKPFWQLKPLMRLIILVLVAIAVTTAALAKADPISAAVRTFAWITHLLFGLAVFDVTSRRQNPSGAPTIWAFLVAGLLLHLLGLVVFVFLIPDPVSYPWTGMLYGTTNIRQLGFYSAAGYALALGLAFSANRRSEMLGLTTLAAIMIAVSFWSGTRSSILAVGAAVMIVLVVVPTVRTRHSLILAIAALVGGMPIAMLYKAPDPSMGVERIFRNEEWENAFNPELRLGRMGLWKGAIRGIKEKPLFGNGESQFRSLVKENEGAFNHPHNSFLQIAYQWGLVGAVCFFTLLAASTLS
jgi:O-Antigen ligase